MICQLEQDVDNSNLIDPNEISSNLHNAYWCMYFKCVAQCEPDINNNQNQNLQQNPAPEQVMVQAPGHGATTMDNVV